MDGEVVTVAPLTEAEQAATAVREPALGGARGRRRRQSAARHPHRGPGTGHHHRMRPPRTPKSRVVQHHWKCRTFARRHGCCGASGSSGCSCCSSPRPTRARSCAPSRTRWRPSSRCVLHPAVDRHRRQHRHPDHHHPGARDGHRSGPVARPARCRRQGDVDGLADRDRDGDRRVDPAWTLGVGPQIALDGDLTVAAIVLWSAFVSSILPLVLKKIRIDPAVVSAPMIATIVDGTGLMIYFVIAHATLPQLAGL